MKGLQKIILLKLLGFIKKFPVYNLLIWFRQGSLYNTDTAKQKWGDYIQDSNYENIES